jgi:AIPR protein
MDLVTQNLVNSFKQEQGFPDDIDNSILFEHFANYCIVSKEYADEFEVEDVHVAGGNDLQLDGIAVIVNGLLVNTIDEIDDLAATNKYIDGEFVFIQSKSGKNFDGAEISNMFYGVRELFSLTPTLPRNDLLSQKEKILRHIYTKSSIFRRGNPQLKLYYVTAGKWQDDSKLKARIENEISTLEELNIFRTLPIFESVDAKRLQHFFSQAQNTLSKTITFSKRVTLPPMKGVKESYLGYLPVSVYLSLITDDGGNLLRGLFYDNVRDFQGDNPVNQEIKQTLVSQEKETFVLLNNGVTVVADDLSVTGDSFNLTGFQIVNGCQTSHVLYQNRSALSDNIYIPIKLIVSPEDILKNQITKATNRQTVVKLEELSALTDFQKTLEQYYNAIQEEHRLYYERRSQQYRPFHDTEDSPEKIQIVTVSTQIRAFASMFLDRAHQASRYYGTLLKDVENRIFVNGHFPISYYVSAYALFRIESLLRKRQLDNKYRAFKYHLLGIMRMQIAGTAIPQMTSNQFEKYCDKIRNELWDEAKLTSAINQACRVLDDTLLGNYDRDKAKDSAIQSQAKVIIEVHLHGTINQ